MTPLSNHLRPLASRIRLPHRGRGNAGRSALPATEERLATKAEIELLQKMFGRSCA
jgi:hypothetical protein